MKHRINHWTAWLTIAGTILAVFSLSALAQYPGSPSDNGLGTTPMSPLPSNSVPRYGNGYGVVPGPPAQPKIATRPTSWPGGTATEPTINGTSPQISQSPQSTQNPPASQFPQQGTYSQTPPPVYNPSAEQTAPPGNPLGNPPANPNSFLPPMGSPMNPPAGQLGWGDPQQAWNGTPNVNFAPPANPQLTQSTVILARVGSEGIFASEITPPVDQYFVQYIAQIKEKVSAEELELHREEIESQREGLIKKSLKAAIESKLIYQDAKRQIPAEGMAIIGKKLEAEFDKSELPKMMKREGATTTKELDEKLKKAGSSLSWERKIFVDKTLVQQWLHQQIKRDEEITYDQMIRYYNAHLKDFTAPAKAKWEELTVTKANYPSKEAAYEAIALMGNQVQAGAPLTEVAKQHSDGFTAQNGGFRDWASKGSLTDAEINEAIFGSPDVPGLPVGQLSQIIETRQDYNIIRVLERADQKTEDFLVAQGDIRKKILDERTLKQIRDYLDGLERRTPIWTIYDGTGGNLKLADRLNEQRR